MILIFYHRRPLYCSIYRDFFTGSQKIPFHKARVLSDVVVVIIGIIFAIASGAGIWSVVGIGTIINACFNGPLIQFFKTKLERFFL